MSAPRRLRHAALVDNRTWRRYLVRLVSGCRWRGRAQRGLTAGGKMGFQLCRCVWCVSLQASYVKDERVHAAINRAEYVTLVGVDMVFMTRSGTHCATARFEYT